MTTKQRLELTWIGKYEQPGLEPRILIEDPSKSYGDKRSENMLIHGDNLLALKALEQDFANKIKCVYIDPPYNTMSAFETYDDNMEHSLWLSLMKNRLVVIKSLLSSNGVIFIHIDDREQAYLKVLCDEIFGRKNFVCSFIWRARSGQGNTVGHIAEQHEYVLCYAKDSDVIQFKKIENISGQGNYSDSKGSYKREQLRQWGQGDRKEDRPSMFFPITAPDGKKVLPKRPDGSDGRWRCSKEKAEELLNDRDLDFVKDDQGAWTCYKKIREGRVTYSSYDNLLLDFGTASTATRDLKELFGEKVFETPKPEMLIRHLLAMSTDENDFVLDSFAGSGSTGCVAHKMKRRWVMIECQQTCDKVTLPRLYKVIDGKDQTGITENVGWLGGGGFKYYDLAPSLLRKDGFGNWVIEEQYKPDMLAAAMAKHEGFKYCPDQQIYWKQGQSTERDYIYTTTNFLTVEMLEKIHGDMKHSESLLICCKSFSKICDGKFINITVKKIPNMLLGRCEFGKKDYSLNIVSMPIDEEEADFVPAGPDELKVKPRGKKVDTQADLFSAKKGKK